MAQSSPKNKNKRYKKMCVFIILNKFHTNTQKNSQFVKTLLPFHININIFHNLQIYLVAIPPILNYILHNLQKENLIIIPHKYPPFFTNNTKPFLQFPNECPSFFTNYKNIVVIPHQYPPFSTNG
jgi:hypothetical protein